jgi:uncharacterized RmlC-like cupin family protein
MSQGPGDLWYFPAGIPHSLQATNDTVDGAEFLLASSEVIASQARPNPILRSLTQAPLVKMRRFW